MGIREEAFPFAAPLLIAAVALGATGHFFWAGLPLACALGVCAFFRDPRRQSDATEANMLSPADGKVIQIKDMGDGTTRISVFMSVFNVHVNRAPCQGTVRDVAYNPGRFMAAWSDKASLDNEQMATVIETPHGPVRVVQIAGLIARRIVCWAVPGRSFQRGERIGLIRFGSRVDLYLPTGRFALLVKLGQHVRAGETWLARWSPAP